MDILLPQLLEGVIGVTLLRVLLQVIHQGVAHGVGEGRLLPPQDIPGQPAALLEGVAEQILALSICLLYTSHPPLLHGGHRPDEGGGGL